MKVSTSIYFDLRRSKSKEKYPVKLRITFNRKTKYYPTKYSLSKDEYEKVIAEKPRGKYKEIKFELSTIEKDAIGIIEKLPYFSFEAFEKKQTAKNYDSNNLYSYMDQKIDELIRVDSHRTAEVYTCAKNSIYKFHTKPVLSIIDVTQEFLKKYEIWMQRNDKSITTTSMYLRCLRHVCNRSMEENQYDPAIYPFRKKNYIIPQPRNIKKSLSHEELKQLYEFPVEPGSQESLYRDIWFFSYLCNGINMKDICMLKHKDVQGEHIYFRREKTKNTSRNSLPVDVPLVDEAIAIMRRWGTKTSSPDDYVFPFLNYRMTVQEVIARVKQETKQTNKYIDRLAKALKIEKKITTYTARHTYATTLKRLGVSVAFIGEQLGQKNTSTTERYLDSIEDEKKFEIANKLLDFKK